MTIHYFTEYSPLGWFGAVHALTDEAVEYAPANSLPGAWSNASHYLDMASRTPVAMPPRPGPHHAFDRTTKQWIDPRTLQDLKNAKWAEIKTGRSAAEYRGFTWDGSTFDSDAISQARIQGAVQLAGMAPDFSIDWTLANNTVRTLSAANMQAVGTALGAHVATQFSRARVLRVQIENATSAQDLADVAWSMPP